MENLLFVYGSLMENFFNYKYIKEKVIERKYAKTKGKLFHQTKKGYPAMIEGEDFVYGELIKLSDWENTIKLLDTLENFYGEGNPENEYNRVLIDVELINEKSILKAYAYRFNLKNKEEFFKNNIYIESGSWRKFMELRDS